MDRWAGVRVEGGDDGEVVGGMEMLCFFGNGEECGVWGW